MSDTIGGAIRKRRRRLGLSQGALALKANVPRVSIQRYESDSTVPSVDRVHQIAKALDTTVDNLIADTGSDTDA